MYSEFPLPSSNTRYQVAWPYLERSHVVVLVDGIPWPHTWVSGTEIDVEAGPDGVLPGTKLEIMRVTPDLASYADIKDASNLDADQLNRLHLQLLYLIQERSGAMAGSLGDAINAIANDVGDISSGLTNVNEMIAQLTSGLVTLGQLNADIVVAKNDAATAKQAILAEIVANDEELTALRNRALGLENATTELGSRITTETTQRSTQLDAMAQSITELTAAYQDGDDTLTAAVTAANLARVNADNALASSIESVRVGLEDADSALSARVDTEVLALQEADTALAARVTTLEVTGGPGETPDLTALYAAIDEVDQARIDGDTALAARATSLEAKVNLADGQTVQGLINQTAQTAADDNEALAAQVVLLQASVGENADAIAQVSDTATATANALDVVEASRVIKTVVRSADGKEAIAGIGLAATSNGTVAQSEVILMGDRFLLTPPGDANGAATPIVVAGTVNGAPTTIFPAARFGDQTIGARVIVDGSITTRQMLVTGGRGSALNADPTCRDASAWSFSSGAAQVTISDGLSGTGALRTTDSGYVQSLPFPVLAGAWYRLSLLVRRAVGGTGAGYFRIRMYNSAGALVSYMVHDVDTGAVYEGLNAVPNSWTRYTGVAQAPNTAVSAFIELLGNYGGTGQTHFQEVRCEQQIDYSLVVQGGLRADRIDTRGMTIKDANGTVIFGSGTNLDYSRITAAAGWLNSNIGINSSGQLYGAGAGNGVVVSNNQLALGANGTLTSAGTPLGSVTIGGLGYSGDLNATSDLTLIKQGTQGDAVIAGNRITKTGVTGWDCGAYSRESYTGGAYVSATVPGPDAFIGLNSDPAAGADYTQLDYAMYRASNNTVYVYINGTHTGGPVASGVTATDVLGILYDGSTVRWYVNGSVVHSVAAAAGQRLYFDSSLYASYSALANIRFGPYGNPSAVQPSNPITSTNASTYIADAAIGNAQIGGDLWSTNYTPGSAGWIIRRNGSAEFRNVTVRGDIQANSLNGVSIVDTLHVAPNAINDAAATITASNVTAAGGAGAVVASVAVDAEGGGLWAIATGRLVIPAFSGSARGYTVYLNINGVDYQAQSLTASSAASEGFAITGFVTGLSGPVNVSVQARITTGSSSGGYVLAGMSLFAIGFKR